jgi:uncharacterized protein DUF4262
MVTKSFVNLQFERGQTSKISIHYSPAKVGSGRTFETKYGYCHTHGIEEAFGHPELVLSFFSVAKTKKIVDSIVETILSKGDHIEPDVAYEGFLKVKVKFKKVKLDGREFLQMVIPGEGNEDWGDAQAIVRKVEKLRGLDDLVKIKKRSVSSSIVTRHWGCCQPIDSTPR